MLHLESTEQPKVSLNSDGKEWIVQLNAPVPDPGSDTKYAFYLIRNGARIAYRWYEKSLIARFKNDGTGGEYKARAFIKVVSADSSADSTITVDSQLITQEHPPYDLRRWRQFPVFELNLAAGSECAELKDGIYQFSEGKNHLHILLSGLESAQKTETVLVCFNGAVTARSTASAPFFSGLGIAKKLGFPLIAVSDPSLSHSQSLTLGWYAGHQGFTDLPFYIAKILDVFAKRTGVRLLLFGGSGGGFASLLVLSLLKASEASAFVWNPQTSISRYSSFAVKRYLEISFSNVSKSQDLRKALDSTGIIHDLTTYAALLKSERPILYIQNKSDWHTVSHAAPLLENFSPQQKITDEILLIRENFAYWEGDWGERHTPPTEKIILSALAGLQAGKSPLAVALDIKNEHQLSRQWSEKND